MKDCEEGGNKVLSPLVKILKNQTHYEWILKKDVKDSCLVLYEQDGLRWYEGLVEKEHSVLVELGLNRVIEVNVKSRELLRVNGEEVSGVEHNQVLDLSDDGERWEGDVLNNQPFGWGVLYDSENRMAYEGFRLKDVNVCYGILYYSDIGVIEYEGEWFEGKRWGRGVRYNRTGNTIFDGEWMNDSNEFEREVITVNGENLLLHSRIEELIVSNSSCNGKGWSVLDLSFMLKLRLLEVGDKCFKCVKEVKLVGLNQLERVVIGEDCFAKGTIYIVRREFQYGYFYLKNCERLRELKIGNSSFRTYSVCEIENVPSLEVIEMGELNGRISSLFWTPKLELKSDYQRMK